MTVGLLVGAGGIGSLVGRMARQSVDQMVVFDADPNKLQALSSELGSVGVAGDISFEESRKSLLGEIYRLGHPLSWVVLSAGVGLRGALTELSTEAVRSAFEVNALAPILLLRDLLREAAWVEKPRVVGIGSISARRALPGRSVYGSTKAAFEAFLMALGAEVAARGIRVNLVSAGVTDTAFIGTAKPELERWASKRVPVGRIGEPQEVASVVAYLLLQAPGYLTCSRIVVDGGAEAMP